MTVFRIFLKFAAVACFAANCLLSLPAYVAYLRYANQHDYRDEVFHVTGAAVTGRQGSQPYLEGTVRGSKEILIDHSVPKMPWPDYLKLVPIGTAIPIKYNPDMTRIQLQYNSMRVLKADWDFLDDLALIRFYLIYVAAPTVVVAAAMYLTRVKK